MTTYYNVPAKEFKEICQAFGYRRKKVWLTVAPRFTITGNNWSGGSKTEYGLYDLGEKRTKSLDFLGDPAPWDPKNPHGQEFPIPPGILVIKTGWFCGKTATMEIVVHPDNVPRLLTGWGRLERWM